MKMLNPEQVAKQFGWQLDYLTDGSPIFQCDKYYTFTSDSVKLAKFVDEENIDTLVDFCSGSGIVGLEIIGRINTKNLVIGITTCLSKNLYIPLKNLLINLIYIILLITFSNKSF